MARVTQALIYQKLESVEKTIAQHAETDLANFQELRRLLEGNESQPGMKIRLDRVEQKEEARKRHFGYIWGCFLVMFGAVLKLLLS